MIKNRIVHGNCASVLAKFPDECIDLTVTSPPYDKIRKYEGFEFRFEEIAKELYRVTKKGGVVVWVVGDATINGSETGTSFKQALYFKDIGFKLYDTMIYEKINPIPLNHKRYEQCFGYMFVFSKGKPKTCNLIKEECMHAGRRNTGTMRNEGSDDLSIKHGYGKPVGSHKRKKNIWKYSVGVNQFNRSQDKKHPAIFPEQLAEDHIISWSNEGDLVLDPMCGSGTTLKMAKANNRHFIGIDCSLEYCEMAKERIGT